MADINRLALEHRAQNVWFLIRNGVVSNGGKDIEYSFHVLPVRFIRVKEPLPKEPLLKEPFLKSPF